MTLPRLRDHEQRAMDPEIRDIPEHHRYELVIDGLTAFVRYRRTPGTIRFIHTEVPDGLAGRGVGSRLASHVLEAARADGVRVVAICPFIAKWMDKHPEYDDLRVAGHPEAADADP
jgi:predicted GNAT family acetyltransferase